MSVLCDVILPEGQTRKYIKTVIGIVVTLVMIKPIVNLASGTLSFDNIQKESSVEVQQSYLDMVEGKQTDFRLANVKNILNARGITVSGISLSQEEQSICVNVNAKQSETVSEEILAVIQTYFDDYKIIIKWSNYG